MKPDPKLAMPPLGRGHNARMLGKLFVVAAIMFGFGFALIPIYKKICEVTGVGLITQRDGSASRFAKNTQVDSSREVIIEFDVNSRGAWRFKPERRSMSVHPGQLVTMTYDLVNTRDRRTVGQAIPSYAPQLSAKYFRKLECFCFNQQTLEANETRKFPLVFVVDPELPRDVGTITLSYTFFEVEGATERERPTATGSNG
ncbi:MAG: cytochrome c oxidase assembly protein [Burkholderiaceae bacterium]